MPDYNNDRELGQGDVVYAVRNAHRGLPVKTLHTGKGDLKLDKLGRCIITDRELAAEVRKEYAQEMAVSRIFRQHPSDRGHHYHFGQVPEMPWRRQHRETEAQEGREAQDDSPAEEQEQEA